MANRVRVEVRNQQLGRIVGFIYYDFESWRSQKFIITAVDDGKKLITGLYVPHISATRSLLQVLFGCKSPKINYGNARLRSF